MIEDKQNLSPIPLHTHWEYLKALEVRNGLWDKSNTIGISDHEKRELQELDGRICNWENKIKKQA